jgi:hypothetical protein
LSIIPLLLIFVGGGVNPNAKQLNKLTITQTTYVFARAKGNNNQWGAIDSVLIKVSF